MAEKITISTLENPEVLLPMDREEFYKEQIEVFRKIGKPSKACQVVVAILFTEKKEIILQKRSLTKAHNPNLIDKSMGGHVAFGDLPFYTVMVETVQELRVPSIILRDNEDFQKTYKLLKNYLDNIAIVRLIDKKILFLEKIIKGEKIEIANDVYLFFGVYSGATKPVDREASGTLYYSIDLLKKEIKQNPSFFTYDLKFFLEKYNQEISKFLNSF